MNKEQILQQQINFLKEVIERLIKEKKDLEVDNWNLEADVRNVMKYRSEDQVEKRVAQTNFRVMFIICIVELVFILFKL